MSSLGKREKKKTEEPKPKRQKTNSGQDKEMANTSDEFSTKKPLKRTPTFTLDESGTESSPVARSASLMRKTSSLLTLLDTDQIVRSLSIGQGVLEAQIEAILIPAEKSVVVDLTELVKISSDIPTEGTESAEESSPSNQITAKVLPVEIWIEIFRLLPTDADRWRLAQSNTWFLSIFQNWVGFEEITVRYELKSLITDTEDIVETITTNHYHVHQSGFNFQVYPVHDLLILTGKSRNTNWHNWQKFFARGYGYIQVYQDYNDYYHHANQLLAKIPLGNMAQNHFPTALFDYCSWLKQEPVRKHWDELIPTRVTVHPDRNCVYSIGINVPHWKEHFAGQTDFGEIGRTLEFVVGALTSKSIENLTWNRPYRGILRPGLPSCQPEGLKLNLFEYQLQGLAWMLNIEHTCKLQKYSFSTILKAPGSLSFGLDARGIAESDSFDASQIILNPDAHITDTKYQESFTSSGGMMADEMGLGKTISMIALILSNPRKTNSNGEFSSLGGEYVVYESKATLILCPSQLITQWEREITTHTSLAVHTVLTIRDQKAQSYQQLLDADVVIVPHNLILDNKKYRDYANSKKSRAPAGVLSKGAVFQQIGWHRIIIDEGHEALSEPLKNNPNAYMNKGYGEWEDFSANYRWYVTGTPVPRGRASLIGALDFIQLKVASGFELQPVVQLLNTPFEYLIFHAAKRCLFWRNTKASVTSQTNIPPLTEKVELIQLSPIEQALYDAANVIGNPKILRAVCSNPLETEVIPASIISEVKTLNDPNLPKMVVEHFREQIERIQEGLPGMKTLITTTREKYELAVVTLEAFGPKPLPAPEGSARAVIEEANARIAQYRALVRDVAKKEGKMKRAADSLTRAENNIIKYVQQSACFSRLLGSPDSDSCDLCDKYLHDPVSLECSHCFCWACIIAHVRKHQACPSCNTTVFLEHIPKPLLKDSPASKKKKSKTQDWFQQTVGTHGTKLASIAKHLRGVMAGDEIVKIIVFSQYDHILETLSNLLAQADPANFADKIISCKGNVHIRKKLIARFNSLDEDSPRILLLSLAHSASGTHLAVATHVILVDPVVGARDEAQATDAQAIARAHRLGQDRPVVAVRFIVERTIDQLDYEHAYGCVPTK